VLRRQRAILELADGAGGVDCLPGVHSSLRGTIAEAALVRRAVSGA
jgi:hypothetical protein